MPGPRTLPALRIRGGGAQEALQALPHDAKALAKSFVVLGGFDKCAQYLATSDTISRPAARKTMHVGAGPLFLLCWPMFSDAPTAKNWAMVGPLCLTLKAALAGSGLINDPKTVASMSRSGDRRELLRGPALYGAVFVAATLTCWRELSGVLALVALCAGDGAAAKGLWQITHGYDNDVAKQVRPCSAPQPSVGPSPCVPRAASRPTVTRPPPGPHLAPLRMPSLRLGRCCRCMTSTPRTTRTSAASPSGAAARTAVCPSSLTLARTLILTLALTLSP